MISSHPLTRAKQIAGDLLADPIAARCVKEFIPSHLLATILDLQIRHSFSVSTPRLSMPDRPPYSAVIIDYDSAS
jgi:hypothetical protein